MIDRRNVTDEFKGMHEAEIIQTLDSNGVALEIAIENIDRDFNMGSIVRTANAFGVRCVHVIGRKQWNKRGAMATDRYMHVTYYQTADEFAMVMNEAGRTIVAVDNVDGARDVRAVQFKLNSVLVFGSEGEGISEDLLSKAANIVQIEQSGSTRSLNVAAAAAIVMYEWVRQQSI